MDTTELINFAKSRFDHAATKRVLKEKYQAKMTFALFGGMWQAGPELLTTLSVCPDREKAVILDLYENPILVNVEELEFAAAQRWQEQMYAWLVEYQETSSKR
jgi:hypothetical protein